MKRLTTFLLTLLLITLGASAQTDFSWKFNIDTWTRDAGNTSAGWYGEYEDGAKERYGDEIAVSGDPVKVLYQTITGLPAGEYTLTFNAVANNAWVGSAIGDDIAQVFVTANGTTQTKGVTVYDQTGCTPSDYPHTFTVTVGADGTLEYGMQNIATGGNWYVAQGVSLTYSGDYTPAEGDQVYGCTTMFSHWGITGNTGGEAFQLNTWSTATGMSVPTCEYWVFNTSNLTAATLSHETLTGLQAGTYEVSIKASATAENASGSVGEGTTFNANGESVDLTTGTYSVPTDMGGNYCGTYTVEATVDDAGTLDISFTIPSGVTYNWLQFQELSVTLKELAAEVEPEPQPEDNSYVFVNTDWVYNAGRTSASDVVYNEDGTITVTASGDNNLSLGNTLDGGVTTTTSEKTVSSEQKWFTIIATNVVTDNDPDNWTSNPSFLWWLNGANYGSQVPATQVETLSDGRVLVAWDVTLSGIDENLKADENYLNGWTCFGITSTTGTSVISDINFYTDEELQEIIDSNTEPGPEVDGNDNDYEEGDEIDWHNFKGTVAGTNLFVNGGFNNGVEGWTAGNGYTNALSEDNVTITEEGGYNGGAYVTLSATGAAGENTPTQAIAVEPGKSYLLVGYTKYSGSDDNLPDSRYSALFVMESATKELSHDENGTSYSDDLVQLQIENTGEWIKTEGVFTVPAENEDGTFSYVGMRMNWSTASYDGLQLYELDGEFTFPEDDDYAEGDEVVVGLNVCTVKSENLFVNGGFNERTTGWTYGNTYTEWLYPYNVTYSTDGGYNDGPYITSKGGGSAANTTPSQPVAVDAGKTYLFVGYTNGTAPSDNNLGYNALFNIKIGDDDALAEDGVITQMNWGDGETWTKTEAVFTADEDHPYVGVRFAWCPGASFDGFQIYEVDVEEIEAEYVYETVYECTAEVDHWTIAGNTNGDFHYNDWSTEADASGMVVPFLEYWVWSGEGNLSAATISHETLTDLPAGDYEATLSVRIFSEAGNEITEGTTFVANGASVDVVATGTADVYGTETEVYGTYTVPCTVDDAGTLDISLVIPEGVTYNWISFKNLKVAEKVSTADIELTAVEGTMNAEVEAAMEDAIATFEKTRTASSYYEAVAAIEAAEASVEYYAPIVAAVDALDEDGAAVWAESDYAEALEARTLTNEDVNADVAAAQKAQTTAGSDMTYVVLYDGTWAADQGNGPNPYNTFATETYIESGEATEGTILYETIEGLTPGTYTVSFYVAANMANGVSGDSGEGITQAFANGEVEAITVGTNSGAQITSLDDMTLVTITCTVDSDGVLEFGLQNVADGGNWFLGAAASLTLVEAAEVEDLSELIAQYEADCTAAETLEANLADMIENGDKTDETKAEMAEALEALEAVMEQYGNIDTTNTTAEELTEAIEAIEAALAEAQDVYTTGLQSVTVATEDDAIYTLSGVRVSKAVKGVYIVNGKKVLVK